MGLCHSDPRAAEAAELSRQVERDLQKRRREAERRVKVLLLGSGESGKSTIFKQMRILHGKGFSTDEREKTVAVIQQNIQAQMQVLVDMASELDFTVADAKAVEEFETLDEEHFGALASVVERLWRDPGIQRTYDRRALFQLDDSAAYFFEKASEVAVPGYVATTEDMLLLRVKTLGIVEEEFEMDGSKFIMFDVGGQQNERKKWIHCFEDVTAVLFVASLSEYDQVLNEDSTRNRLEEALDLFDEIANSRWFDNTAMMLFLNKHDRFSEKIRRVDIRQERPDGSLLFEDYDGGCDHDSGLAYIRDLFIARNRNEDRNLYFRVTTATSTSNIDEVFRASKHIILQDSLGAGQFLH